ncbi:MAG TPA: DUF2207 domain-containing protein [Candidatus Saccharimonadales bacterium]
MKRLILIFLAAMTFAAIPTPTHAGPNDFTFTSFDADYYLSKDTEGRSTLAVTETLVAEFPSINQNHGIERAIPTKYDNHPLSLSIKSVTDIGKSPLAYTTYTSNDNTILRIGDADSYVHGTQAYVINYTLRDVTITQNSSQEFFWNINGTQWQQPFSVVSARIHLDPSIAVTFDKRTICYTGNQGSTAKNCEIDVVGETITVTSTGPLQPAENLSVAIGFTPNTFTAYVTPPTPVWVYILAVIAGVFVLITQIIAPIWLLRYAYRTWKKYGTDVKGRGTIIPEYSKPANHSMLDNSVALNETVTPTAISATFIDLAIRGYLMFTDKGKALLQSNVFELTIVKPVTDVTADEKEVLQLLFSSLEVGTTASTKKYRPSASQKMTKIQESTYSNMISQNLFVDNIAETKKLKMWGLIFTIVSFFIFGIISFIAGVITLIFVSKMPARTADGTMLRDHLLGNKLYMQVAETDRIRTLQSVTGAERIDTTDGKQVVKLYEKLLPLAVIFGIEKEWTKQFPAVASDYQPSWYSTSNGNLFNAALLGASLNSFSTTLEYSTFAAPSSGASGGSGFSGGSSGGGGGGGGGGGW